MGCSQNFHFPKLSRDTRPFLPYFSAMEQSNRFLLPRMKKNCFQKQALIIFLVYLLLFVQFLFLY